MAYRRYRRSFRRGFRRRSSSRMRGQFREVARWNACNLALSTSQSVDTSVGSNSFAFILASLDIFLSPGDEFQQQVKDGMRRLEIGGLVIQTAIYRTSNFDDDMTDHITAVVGEAVALSDTGVSGVPSPIFDHHSSTRPFGTDKTEQGGMPERILWRKMSVLPVSSRAGRNNQITASPAEMGSGNGFASTQNVPPQSWSRRLRRWLEHDQALVYFVSIEDGQPSSTPNYSIHLRGTLYYRWRF